MRKKIGIALCGLLIFAMLPAGCGKTGAQTQNRGKVEKVSDGKIEDELEEQEKLSDAKDDKADAEKDVAADKDAKDPSSVKTDAAKTQEDKADPKTVDNGGEAGSTSSGSSKADSSSGNTNGGNSAGNAASGSNGSESGTSGSSANTGNISNGAGTSHPEHSHSEHTQSEHSHPEHTHSWVEQTTTVTHEAAGHYETVVVKDAWDEDVYGYRDICLGCGHISATAEEAGLHCVECETGMGYTNKKIVVDTIHHEAETQEVWVEDLPAWTETVGTGSYTCSTCGATK